MEDIPGRFWASDNDIGLDLWKKTDTESNINTSSTSFSSSQNSLSASFFKLIPDTSETKNVDVTTFTDGVRSIDYVLVWDESKSSAENILRRDTFERNLSKVGLELEYEPPVDKLHFIKIHLPSEVVTYYCEALQIRIPLKEKGDQTDQTQQKQSNVFLRYLTEKWNWMFHITEKEKPPLIAAYYSKDKEDIFDTDLGFKSPLVRLRIMQFILDTQKFSDADSASDNRSNHDLNFGISRLIANNTYCAAYPLHDGDLKTPDSRRYRLKTEWASLSKCFKFQPLDDVKEYFGVKIGLYFAWLGFYTLMLIPPSIVGLLCFIYSVKTRNTDPVSNQVCNFNSTIPRCPKYYKGPFKDLKDSCNKLKVTYLFDNPTIIIFAVYMNIWTCCFLEFWKRYLADLAYRWDLTGFNKYEEQPRPAYLRQMSLLKNKRLEKNEITGNIEPVPSFWRIRFPAYILSYSVIILLILVVISTTTGTFLYKASFYGAHLVRGYGFVGKIYVSIMTSSINLVFIIVFGYIYQYIAKWLTENEKLRTKLEFENSLIRKMYILQFINYYSSSFYIAFFKGRFFSQPIHPDYIKQECSTSCLLELSIHLAITMIGNQLLYTLKELVQPYIKIWWKVLRNMRRKKEKCSRWVEDFKLVYLGNMGLFYEYLEMVIQFGFITMFVSAFPLAPLIALINNVLELRLDAQKFIRYYQRPIPERVNSIGAWYRILDIIKKLSVVTNGFIIAFSTELIPKFLYMYENGDMTNYVNNTLTITLLNTTNGNSSTVPTKCSYWHFSYFEPVYGNNSYSELSSPYSSRIWFWKVIAFRLMFVILYEHVVGAILVLMHWSIPNMSSKLRYWIQREEYHIKKTLLEEGRTSDQGCKARAIQFRRAANRVRRLAGRGGNVVLYV